jgi:hypothetical protein
MMALVTRLKMQYRGCAGIASHTEHRIASAGV